MVSEVQAKQLITTKTLNVESDLFKIYLKNNI